MKSFLQGSHLEMFLLPHVNFGKIICDMAFSFAKVSRLLCKRGRHSLFKNRMFGFKQPPLKPHQDSCTFLNRKYFDNNNAK